MDHKLCEDNLVDCERSLIAQNNGFDQPDYDDICYCKENLQYVINNLKKHPDRARQWAGIIQ